MTINNQVEASVKLNAVREYLGGNGSLNEIAEKYSAYRSNYRNGCRIINCLEKLDYSIDFKITMIRIIKAAGVGIIRVTCLERL